MPSASRTGLTALTAAAAVTGGLMLPATAGAAAPAPSTSTVAVPNGGFEAPLTTWQTADRTSGIWRAAPRTGDFSLGVFPRSGSDAAAEPETPIIGSTVRTGTYSVTAEVSVPAGAVGRLELVEAYRGKVIGTTPVDVAPTGSGWTTSTVRREARSTGGTLTVRLAARSADKDQSVRYDAVRAEATTPAGTPAPAPATSPWTGGTLFGGTVHRNDGEGFTRAMENSKKIFGTMDVYRVFATGLPPKWPGDQGLSGGPVVVSFKAKPQDVLAGKHDAYFTDWFAAVPATRPVWWSYWHEPEDDAEDGRFTPAQYRAAWARLDGLATKARKPQLRSTLILMCWSLERASKRNWKDYYPGGAVIDTLGWDCYNPSVDKGVYASPESRFRQLADASAGVGKPFAIAEFGSRLAAGDDGTRRGQWLKDTAAWMKSHRAQYVTYFDANVGGDFRLMDAPSQAAWRWVVRNL